MPPRRKSRVSGDESSGGDRRKSKGDVGGIVTTQYAAKQSIRKLRKQTSGTSYKSITSIGSESGAGAAVELLPPVEDIDDEVFEDEVKKERTKSTESDMRSASGGKQKWPLKCIAKCINGGQLNRFYFNIMGVSFY